MSSSTGLNIRENELYPTPEAVVEALMRVVRFRPSDMFLEPCKGTGAIINKVPLPFYQKVYAELSEGVDYLTTPFPKVDVIITNPPFSLTEEFLRKSFRELKPDGTLIYLQRVNFLGSLKRVPFWAEVGFPEKTPIIVPRPRFVGGKSDSCEYAWFIWDRGYRVCIPDGISHILTLDTPVNKV
jgi:hypothetical protein